MRCAEAMARTQYTHIFLASFTTEHFPQHRVWKSSFKYKHGEMMVETMLCNDIGFDNLTHNTITVILTVTMNVFLHAHIAH